MTAAEKEVIRAANHLAALLEAAAPKRGLKHRRHARHIVPARAKVEAVLRKYWARQEAAVLEEIKPRIRAALAAHPQPVKEGARLPVHMVVDADTGDIQRVLKVAHQPIKGD